MPFEVGDAINNATDKLLSSRVLFNVAKNPVYTAILITFIVVLVTAFVFRDTVGDDGNMILCIRTGFWTFAGVMAVIFVHNKVLSNENLLRAQDNEYDSVVTGSYSGIVLPGAATHIEDSIVPIHINTDFTEM
jgi:short subunit fatty acids transporter